MKMEVRRVLTEDADNISDTTDDGEKLILLPIKKLKKLQDKT